MPASIIVRLSSLSLAAALLLPLSAIAETELRGTPTELAKILRPEVQTVTLTGEARIDQPVESGVVTVGIRTRHARLHEALTENHNIRAEVLGHLTNSNIPAGSITGSRFSTTPRYGLFSSKPKEYEVDNILYIPVRKESQLQAVAELCDSYRDLHFAGITLDHKNLKEMKKRLLNNALADLRTRKAIYEKSLGVRLKAISFSESFTPVNEEPPVQQSENQISSLKPSAPLTRIPRSLYSFAGRVTVHYEVIPRG